MDLSRQKVGSQLSAMNAATAQLVTGTSGDPEEIDYTTVGAAVNVMWVLAGSCSDRFVIPF